MQLVMWRQYTNLAVFLSGYAGQSESVKKPTDNLPGNSKSIIL